MLVAGCAGLRAANEPADADTLLIPDAAWPCGLPAGIPAPESGKSLFTATIESQSYDLGTTPYGKRRVLVFKSGACTGEKLAATVMPGGLDFELTLPNGVVEIEQVLVLKTSDGKYIYLKNLGTGTSSADVRLVADFEAPNASAFAWLNHGTYLARWQDDTASGTRKLEVYALPEATNALATAKAIHIVKPADLPAQPVDFRHAAPNEERGEAIASEQVGLGPSESVGATKMGGRNIIPLTGGTVSGLVSGKVLAAGADFQHLGNPTTLDARYLWQTDDGEVIIVRNGGPPSSLAPRFEASINGKYAWLNTGNYLSSGPKVSAGAVSLTFYRSKD
jgi:hypothetical protein